MARRAQADGGSRLMATESSIQGLDPILAKLKTLGPKLQKKALNAAMRKAMGIVRKSAVAGAKRFDDPATAQSIAKEIVVRSNTKKARRMGPGHFLVQVGVKGGAKSYVNNRKNRSAGRVGGSYEGGGNVYHWRFLEFGTKDMRAQPFMRPALAENVDAVTNTMTTELDKAIDKIIESGQA
jgi:HK97 gp10 family phage protein